MGTRPVTPVTKIKVTRARSQIGDPVIEKEVRAWPYEAPIIGARIATDELGLGDKCIARLWVNGQDWGTLRFENRKVYVGHDLGGQAHWVGY